MCALLDLVFVAFCVVPLALVIGASLRFASVPRNGENAIENIFSMNSPMDGVSACANNRLTRHGTLTLKIAPEGLFVVFLPVAFLSVVFLMFITPQSRPAQDELARGCAKPNGVFTMPDSKQSLAGRRLGPLSSASCHGTTQTAAARRRARPRLHKSRQLAGNRIGLLAPQEPHTDGTAR